MARRRELLAHAVGFAVLGIGVWAFLSASSGLVGALIGALVFLGMYVTIICLGCWCTLAYSRRRSAEPESGGSVDKVTASTGAQITGVGNGASRLVMDPTTLGFAAPNGLSEANEITVPGYQALENGAGITRPDKSAPTGESGRGQPHSKPLAR